MDEQLHTWEEYLHTTETRLTAQIVELRKNANNERRWLIGTLVTAFALMFVWLIDHNADIRVLYERTSGVASLAETMKAVQTDVALLLQRTRELPPSKFEALVNERFARQAERLDLQSRELQEIKMTLRELSNYVGRNTGAVPRN